MCVCVLNLACFGFLSFFQFLVLFVQKCFENLEGGNFAHISIHFLKSQIGERDIQIWHTLSYSCHILTCSPNRTSCSAPPPDWRRSLTQGGWVNSMGPTVRPSVRPSVSRITMRRGCSARRHAVWGQGALCLRQLNVVSGSLGCRSSYIVLVCVWVCVCVSL